MTSPQISIGRRGRRLNSWGNRLSSFKFKLVAYFVLLSLVPLAATYWGFSTVAGSGASRQVTLRQEEGPPPPSRSTASGPVAHRRTPSGLRACVRSNGHSSVATAERCGRSSRERRSPLSAWLALRVGSIPSVAARVPVDVVADTKRLGEVVASVPLDTGLIEDLCRGAALGSGDVLVLLEGTRIAASAPSLSGRVPVAPGRSATIRVAGVPYRAFVAPALPGVPSAKLAVLTQKTQIDAADARTRNRLLAGLLACLALVGVVAYLQGRSIVRNLGDFATVARGIAHGALGERVPVRGRDEFAALGTALNDMAAQLEARLAELEAERTRAREALARFGEALAATHDPQQLLRVVAAEAVEATSACVPDRVCGWPPWSSAATSTPTATG